MKKHTEVTRQPTELIAEATKALTEGDALGALGPAQQALDSSTPAFAGAIHSLLGQIYLDLGDPARARSHLTAATRADPDGALPDAQGGGVDKFLYLAQLDDAGGRASVVWFERGAAALRARIASLKEAAQAGGGADARAEAEAEARRSKLAEVLCAVAEVYMTDLSWEDDCEDKCDRLVTEAAMLAPTCADVWQTVASVRVSQNRAEDAKAALERSLAAWEHLPPDDDKIPEFPVRVSLVRLLMTVGWLEKAIEIAERLVREDDQSVEVWYLGGYGLYLVGEALKAGGELQNWEAYWTSARRWLARCLKLFREQEYEDDRLHDHATELLDAVVAEIGPAPAGEEEEDGADWEDASGEEEDSEGDEESNEQTD